jgi:ubiquinone/menaquinone biosynthesis C-methylase UbiE
MANSVEDDTINWYKKYYSEKGSDRNDSFNSGVVFQELAAHIAFINAFQNIPKNAKILDVGGGGGAGCLKLISVGFNPENLTNVDIIPDRIADSQKRLPSDCTSICCDASQMNTIPDNSFDVVFSMTMFIQLTDEKLAHSIASEMVRVCKPGGTLLIFDWRYDFGRTGYLAVNKRRLIRLFHIGTSTKLLKTSYGQLIPPIGRFLSKYLPACYFPVRVIRPLVGLVAYRMLKKQ